MSSIKKNNRMQQVAITRWVRSNVNINQLPRSLKFKVWLDKYRIRDLNVQEFFEVCYQGLEDLDIDNPKTNAEYIQQNVFTVLYRNLTKEEQESIYRHMSDLFIDKINLSNNM